MKKKHEKLGKSFSERVVEAALSIPVGRVTTYGRLARACGAGQGAKSDDGARSQQAKGSMSARSITGILGKAYQEGEKNIPFHRIVYANGRIWTSPEYHTKRMKLYKKEGIVVNDSNVIVNFGDIVFDFV
jgi:alkylated DNA nucleotide flippase Atl1